MYEPPIVVLLRTADGGGELVIKRHTDSEAEVIRLNKLQVRKLVRQGLDIVL